MNAPTRDTNGDCFTDFALQEYTLGRLDGGVRRELEEHLSECGECAAAHNLLTQETKLLREIVGAATGSETAGEVDDETLAMYLDESLEDAERLRCEAVLATSSDAIGRLIELQRELRSLRDTEGVSRQSVGSAGHIEPEGLILRMPKRLELPRALLDLPDTEVGEA